MHEDRIDRLRDKMREQVAVAEKYRKEYARGRADAIAAGPARKGTWERDYGFCTSPEAKDLLGEEIHATRRAGMYAAVLQAETLLEMYLLGMANNNTA